jgi:hypothetical protein
MPATRRGSGSHLTLVGAEEDRADDERREEDPRQDEHPGRECLRQHPHLNRPQQLSTTPAWGPPSCCRDVPDSRGSAGCTSCRGRRAGRSSRTAPASPPEHQRGAWQGMPQNPTHRRILHHDRHPPGYHATDLPVDNTPSSGPITPPPSPRRYLDKVADEVEPRGPHEHAPHHVPERGRQVHHRRREACTATPHHTAMAQ